MRMSNPKWYALLVKMTCKSLVGNAVLLVHTFKMRAEVIRSGPNFVLGLTAADATDISIARGLAFGVFAPFMSVEIIRRTKALFLARATFKVAFEWLLMALLVLSVTWGG